MKERDILASIIIVTRNGSGVISDCLRSVKMLDYPKFEVILVDNGSIDDTVRLAQGILPSARVILLSSNKGYGGGCNEGAKASNGEILVFVNQDVSLDPTFLDKIVSEMGRDDTIGLCGGSVLSWDRTWLVSSGQAFERWTGYGLDRGFGSPYHGRPDTDSEVFSPNGAAFAVRRCVFEEVGGFDATLFLYFDETDLAWRARIAGSRVTCCHDATVRHLIDPRRAHSSRSRYYIDRNSLLCEARNYELHNLLVFLPTSVLSRIAGIVVLTILGRGEHARSTARALRDFFALIPIIRRGREMVVITRKVRDREIMRKDLLASPTDVLEVFRSSFLPSTTKIGGDPQ